MNDTVEQYEANAEAFYRETRILAPGKDVPAAIGDYDEHELRSKLWRVWLEKQRMADRIRELESPPRPEPVAWVAPHNTLYLFDGYEFTIITRRPDGKLSVSGGDDMPENFDDEVGAAGIYRFVGSVHSAEGWTSEQCEAAGIPSDASNYSEWWNGHMEDATLADVAHVFGIPHPSEAAGVPDLNNIIGNDGREWPQTFDGMAWATAFNRQFPSVSVDDALSWFCNAIMRGYDTHAQKQPGAVVELDEWRVVDNANRTVQTYETETAATGQPTSVFLATLDKRLPDRAPHRVMRVCLTEVDV